ncbi:MAG: sulfur carrier protein ThiS [Acidobacteria bacterium]|nr:sulfur carrier protein ThiS [Acidobacteriota bacterium]
MEVIVNGACTNVPDRISIGGLLDVMELKKERIAVELNRGMVPRRQWEEIRLESGDQLEIVQFVGGG